MKEYVNNYSKTQFIFIVVSNLINSYLIVTAKNEEHNIELEIFNKSFSKHSDNLIQTLSALRENPGTEIT